MAIASKDLIKIKDVPAKLIELSGTTRSAAAIYMWIHKGRQTYDGKRIFLKTVRRLGDYFTTEKWLSEFIKRI